MGSQSISRSLPTGECMPWGSRNMPDHRPPTTGGLDLIASQVSAQLKILEFATIQSILKNPSLPGLPEAL